MPSPPKPKSGENAKDYIPRCMHAIRDCGDPQDQRLAACYTSFREAKKSEFISSAFQVFKSILNRVSKTALPVGTVKTRKDGTKWKKIAPGQWEQVRQERQVQSAFSEKMKNKKGKRTPEEEKVLQETLLNDKGEPKQLYDAIKKRDSSEIMQHDLENMELELLDGDISYNEFMNDLKAINDDLIKRNVNYHPKPEYERPELATNQPWYKRPPQG
jgi:hypothetical protein